MEKQQPGFSLDHLDMGGFAPPIWGGDKVLMEGAHEKGHRLYGGT